MREHDFDYLQGVEDGFNAVWRDAYEEWKYLPADAMMAVRGEARVEFSKIKSREQALQEMSQGW